MSGHSEDRQLGKRDGLRWAITWLRRRAAEMNDPHAKAALYSAAFDLGNAIREGHIPFISETTEVSDKSPDESAKVSQNLLRALEKHVRGS